MYLRLLPSTVSLHVKYCTVNFKSVARAGVKPALAKENRISYTMLRFLLAFGAFFLFLVHLFGIQKRP